MSKKDFSEKKNITKNKLFFFREVQLFTVLFLIWNSDTSLSNKKREFFDFKTS